MYGCAKYSAFNYIMINSTYEGPFIRHAYGGMILPLCSHSEARPLLASLVFVSFTIFCGFILMNLTIAAVAAGIKDRLDELRKEDLEQELGLVSGPNGGNGNAPKGPPGLPRLVSSRSMSKLPQDSKSSSLLTNPQMLLILLKQVWKEQEIYSHKINQQQESSKNGKNDFKNRIYQKIRFKKDQQLSKVLEEPDNEGVSTSIHPNADNKDTNLADSGNEVKVSPSEQVIPQIEKNVEDKKQMIDNADGSDNKKNNMNKVTEEKEPDRNPSTLIIPSESINRSSQVKVENIGNNEPIQQSNHNEDEFEKGNPHSSHFPLKHASSSLEEVSYAQIIKSCFKLQNQSVVMRDLTNHRFYQNISVGLVTISAIIELYTLQLANKNGGNKPVIANWIQVGLQVLFTADLYCKVVAAYPGIATYFHNRWNEFDAVLVLATWIPVFTIGVKQSIGQYIGNISPFTYTSSTIYSNLFYRNTSRSSYFTVIKNAFLDT